MDVTFRDVEQAAARLDGHAHRTPLTTSRRLSERTGATVLLKPENLQRAGAFKFRGAFNALAQLAPGRPVAAFSSGNHAQAVALAARLTGRPAVIVMPEDAPASKVAATLGYGAEVVRYDRYTQDRELLAKAVAAERGAALVPPFDHPHVIAGQGTAVKELIEDAGGLDVLLVPLGGGGLLSGSLLSARALTPGCRVYGVEPEAGDDGRRSLAAGRVVTIDVPRTIADGAQTTALGALPFSIISRDVDDVLVASDTELVEAMRALAATTKLVVEPTGALALAALLAGRVPDVTGRRVGVVLSGGNVDLDRYAALLTGVPG